MTAAFSRLVKVGTALVTVPLMINYLGTEEFALWMTISASAGFLSFSDFGMGQGLVTKIAQSAGRRDSESAKVSISSAFFMLVVIAGVLAGVFLILRPVIEWDALLGFSDSGLETIARDAVTAFMAVYLFSIPLLVVDKVELGYQESYIANAFDLFGHVLALAGMITLIVLDSPLWGLLLAITGGPTVSMVINGLILFRRRRPELRPTRSAVSRREAGSLAGVGWMFLVLQLSAAVAFASDTLIASHVLGAEAVAEYSVAFRLLSTVPLLTGFILIPLWPAYGEAYSRGELVWIKATLLKSIRIVVSVSLVVVALIFFFGQKIIDLWIGGEVRPTKGLLFWFGVWMLLMSLGAALKFALNGMARIRIQMLAEVVMAPINIVLSLILAGSMGVAGVVLGSAISYGLIVVIPLANHLRTVLTQPKEVAT